MKGGSEVISRVGILPGALEAFVELERACLSEHEHMRVLIWSMHVSVYMHMSVASKCKYVCVPVCVHTLESGILLWAPPLILESRS